MKLTGRRKIYTSEKFIDETNIIEVLKDAYPKHIKNAIEIQYLIDYERGIQPLNREKIIRKDIDIKTSSSLPNYIKTFKLGYNWGCPITLVQRGDADFHKSNSHEDDSGISALNEQLKNNENISYKDNCMAEFLQICGIGHKMVDIKSDFPQEIDGEYSGSIIEDYYLDSRYAFCVYYSGPGQKKVLGVSFLKSSGKVYFTCTTDKWRFEIEGWEINEKIPNPLGKISIVEFERSPDRTGCFERQVPEIDRLNILTSDLANDTAQRTQEIWWGDNIQFKDDKKPESGEWVLTASREGSVAKIQPLSSTFDSGSTISAINESRITILQDAYVPIQYSSSGGGSTGIATDMSSGWSAAELDALKEQQMTEMAKREELELINRAIKFVPERIVPMDSPIRKVHTSDVEFHFNRRKNYDMSIKANTFATYFQNGVHPRHILQIIDAFPDTEQTYLDSEPMFKELQKNMIGTKTNENSKNITASDMVNQIDQSPILDGMNTANNT